MTSSQDIKDGVHFRLESLDTFLELILLLRRADTSQCPLVSVVVDINHTAADLRANQ